MITFEDILVSGLLHAGYAGREKPTQLSMDRVSKNSSPCVPEPEFLRQPHDLHPMTRKRLKNWLEILKTEFPDHHRLSEASRRFYPRTPRQAHARLPAVLEMTDEDSSKSIEPDFETAVEWLELMSKQGAYLEFSHKNGDKPLVNLTDRETLDAVLKTSGGRIRRNRKGLDRAAVEGLMGRYLHEKGWRLWLGVSRESLWRMSSWQPKRVDRSPGMISWRPKLLDFPSLKSLAPIWHRFVKDADSTVLRV